MAALGGLGVLLGGIGQQQQGLQPGWAQGPSAKQLAQMQAAQMQAQAQQAYYNNISSTAAPSGAMYFGTTQTATTTSTITNAFVNTANTWASSPDFGRPPTEAELEVYLQRKLAVENKMLLACQRYAFRPPLRALNLADDTPIHYPKIYDRLGYLLEKSASYLLPDGSRLELDEYGNYFIDDHESKVTYKANRIREFNPYINASDQLERFIREVGHLDGVDQGEVLQLPVEAFINWLVLQAALKDGDRTDHLPRPQDAIKPLPALPKPTEVHIEQDLEKDCVVVKEVYVKRYPRFLIEDGQIDLTQKYGIKAA